MMADETLCSVALVRLVSGIASDVEYLFDEQVRY